MDSDKGELKTSDPDSKENFESQHFNIPMNMLAKHWSSSKASLHIKAMICDELLRSDFYLFDNSNTVT